MRCHHCNEKLAAHDLWCVKCGKRTETLSNDLSSMRSLKESWKKYRPFQGANLPVGIVGTLIGVVPLAILLWLLNFALPEMPHWKFISLHIVVWTLFIPTMIVPFNVVCKTDDYKIDLSGFMNSFKSYGEYLLFSFLSVLFYVIIFFLCQGDPILNLVWLVLVLYWIAIAIPIPVLMKRYKINAWQGIRVSYKYAGDVRWNIFLLGLVLVVANFLAAILLVIGLAVIIPFTWFAIRDFTDKMIEFEIFEDKALK